MGNTSRLRNAGPSWGYRALIFWDRWLPQPVAQCLLSLGTFIALICMKKERASSQAYLSEMTQRPAGILESYRHFRTFVQYLMVKLRAGTGREPTFSWAPDVSDDTDSILRGSNQLLLGTFHLGYSDLIGFKLGDLNRRISMVRLRIANSEDVEKLAELTTGNIELIWANVPQDVIFEMKQAMDCGKSLAMQCDRLDNGGKVEAFSFLNEKRLFPITIYRFARLFKLPVMFCFAIPSGPMGEHVIVHASSLWDPEGSENYRDHFQAVLFLAESLLRENPYQWFNFSPLNPIAE